MKVFREEPVTDIDLGKLADRLAEATGPDLALDALLVQAVYPVHGSVPQEWWGLSRQPTASLDAALLLVGAAFPGFGVSLETSYRGRIAYATIKSDVQNYYGVGASLPLAVMLALVVALADLRQ